VRSVGGLRWQTEGEQRLTPNEFAILDDDFVVLSLFGVEVGDAFLGQARSRALFALDVFALALVEPVEEVVLPLILVVPL